MDDPALVRHLHGLGQRGHECGGRAGRLGRARELLGQAAPLDELHGEVRPALDVARVVHLHDVRVPQAGEGRGLPAEAPEFLRTGERAGEQHLDRDRAVERALPGLVDDAHAAAAEHRLHLVAGDLRQVGGRRRGRDRAGTRSRPKAREQLHDCRVDEAELLPPLAGPPASNSGQSRHTSSGVFPESSISSSSPSTWGLPAIGCPPQGVGCRPAAASGSPDVAGRRSASRSASRSRARFSRRCTVFSETPTTAAASA